MTYEDLAQRIETLYDDPAEPNDPDATRAVREVIDLLDRGKVRVAEKHNGEWTVTSG